MPRIVVHAGMDKTGTTSVQSALAGAYEVLRHRRILYPLAGRYRGDINHLALFYSLSPDKGAIPTPLPDPPASADAYLAALQAEIAEADPKVVILSCEALWLPSAFPAATLAAFADRLAPSDVEFVVFLRESEGYLLSTYAQAIRGPQRATLSFEEHVKQVAERRVLHYDDRLSELRAVAGPDRVHVRIHGRDSTLVEMLRLVGCGDLTTGISIETKNEKPSWLGTRLHRTANRLGVPNRVKKATIEPLDAVWKTCLARSSFLSRLDRRLRPPTGALVRALARSHPLPSGY